MFARIGTGYGFHGRDLKREGADLVRRVASLVTTTTNFLAPDILDKCGRAVPAPSEALHSTLRPIAAGWRDRHPSTLSARTASLDHVSVTTAGSRQRTGSGNRDDGQPPQRDDLEQLFGAQSQSATLPALWRAW
jgi:hypothetical protein